MRSSVTLRFRCLQVAERLTSPFGLRLPPSRLAGEEWLLGPFSRCPGNPVLGPRGDAWESKDVFNPAAWTDGKRVYLLYRAEDNKGLGSRRMTSRIGLATSLDGINFDRRPIPVLGATESYERPGGCEDPRLVKVKDTFYLTYTAYDGRTARLALATSKDLVHWKKHGLVFPWFGWTKSGAVLDRKIHGRYWMYFGDTNIWAAHSEDLLHWTLVKEPVMRPRPDRFDSELVEPGPPPIVTRHGILLMYNSMDDHGRYACGQALFSLKDPTKLLRRTDYQFLAPCTDDELCGQTDQVVFAEGMVRFKGRWLLYYGMADSKIGAAVHEEC